MTITLILNVIAIKHFYRFNRYDLYIKIFYQIFSKNLWNTNFFLCKLSILYQKFECHELSSSLDTNSSFWYWSFFFHFSHIVFLFHLSFIFSMFCVFSFIFLEGREIPTIFTWRECSSQAIIRANIYHEGTHVRMTCLASIWKFLLLFFISYMHQGPCIVKTRGWGGTCHSMLWKNWAKLMNQLVLKTIKSKEILKILKFWYMYIYYISWILYSIAFRIHINNIFQILIKLAYRIELLYFLYAIYIFFINTHIFKEINWIYFDTCTIFMYNF